ncbi:MAG: DNA repair protein RadA [Chloroflexi bacterium]|nr:DNA repair protein RadA [Chloroflexota bacterium]
MARSRTTYRCRECGRQTPHQLGRCPACGEFNTMETFVAAPPTRAGRPQTNIEAAQASRLADIPAADEERLPIPIGELSRVLGGGLVPGSVTLLGGEPGIGKSTLLTQLAGALSATLGRVLYVSGEESLRQLSMRARRLGLGLNGSQNSLYLLAETQLERILATVDELDPTLLIIDSIQTAHSDAVNSAPGMIGQIRECAGQLQARAKAGALSVLLVGHVTKEGSIAGPRVLEHIVDTVLYLEGDPFQTFRLLRSVKNRFGATSEVGVFEMSATGLVEVANPSEAFLQERAANAPGSAIAVLMEGTRPLLVELQALTSRSAFSHPRRTPNGLDLNRLLMLCAVLQVRANLPLQEQDVFVNVVGGLRIREPAADLATALALASSIHDQPLPSDMVCIGELGLSGELRSVGQLDARLAEAAQVGFRRAIVPRRRRGGNPPPAGLSLVEVRDLRGAIAAFATSSS